MKQRFYLLAFCLLHCLCTFAEIHSKEWEKFDGKWTNDSLKYVSNFSIQIEEGDLGEVQLEFSLQIEGITKQFYPVFAPLTEEGGECTDVLWGGPNLVTQRDIDENGDLPIYNTYKKSMAWPYVVEQIRSNSNGVILFEIETSDFPLTDDYSIKALVEHELGLMTSTAQYCVCRYAYAAILKSHNAMELVCLGECRYFYGTDRNGNYGFVGGLFDSDKKINGQSSINLHR